ncbi:MAG: hypothetical protein IJW26_06105, partial [Clostridia bacterium]|nr:hypothetical protein [Clostridia bacterium]
TQDKEIQGVLIDATIDVFGNYYLIYSQNSITYLIRYYKGFTTIPTQINYNVLNVQTDFNGNVYVLDDNNNVFKYLYDANSKSYTQIDYEIDVHIDGLICKDFALNYLNDKFYALSNACIFISYDNALQIDHLQSISANNVNLENIALDLKFIQVNEKAKMFKVTVDDYIVDGNNLYFKDIEAIANPNTTKIYLVISELDNYYLISYSPSFYALVRKSSVEEDATLISPDEYDDNNIVITDYTGETKYITNKVSTYSRPIVDDNFTIKSYDKNTQVYILKTITFNNKTLALIAEDSSLTPASYILEGYLKNEITVHNDLTSEDITIAQDDVSRKISNVFAILSIALALTVCALILEKKLLFNDKL